MQDQFSRTQMLIGKPALDTLKGSHVAVFGVGGVGGYVVEVLVRSGVGELALIDNDRVCITNINRQIIATLSQVDRLKVDVCEERIRDINPHCIVHKYPMFYLPQNADTIDLSAYDYVVDCIDTITAKLELIRRCHELQIPIISSMGAANKMDPTAFRVTDIFKTNMDPLAKIIRKKLRKLNIHHLKVVYSEEVPLDPILYPELMEEDLSVNTSETEVQNLSQEASQDATKNNNTNTRRRSIPASNAFVPAAAGLVCGGEVIKDLIRKAGTERK